MEDLGGALDELTVLLQLGAHAHVAELVANGDDLAVGIQISPQLFVFNNELTLTMPPMMAGSTL